MRLVYDADGPSDSTLHPESVVSQTIYRIQLMLPLYGISHSTMYHKAVICPMKPLLVSRERR